MKHNTNAAFKSYESLWKSIFPNHYKEKYDHDTGLSGGGGDYPFYDIHLKQDVFLWPFRKFKLASSVEFFDVPNDYYLRTANKSSIARQGIDASFNTLIDNGFKGFLTIEIKHNSMWPKKLKAGQPILKVEAVKCLFNSPPYDGKYQNQADEPVSAKI